MAMKSTLLVSCLVFACSSPDTIGDGRRLLTEKGCEACHSVDGTPRIGPSFKAAVGKRVRLESGQEVTFDEPYFVESVLEPDAKIVEGFPRGAQPSFTGHLDDGELRALFAYVETL